MMATIPLVEHNLQKDEEQLCVWLQRFNNEPQIIQNILFNCQSGLFHVGEATFGLFRRNDSIFGKTRSQAKLVEEPHSCVIPIYSFEQVNIGL